MNFFHLNSVILLVLSMLFSEVLGQACPTKCDPQDRRRPVCGHKLNLKCYENFANKCELDRANCQLKPNEQYQIARFGKCDQCKCLTPLCCGKIDCSKETDKRVVCGKSTSQPPCFRQFGNECLWRKWNCDNPRQKFTKQRVGPCNRAEQPRC